MSAKVGLTFLSNMRCSVSSAVCRALAHIAALFLSEAEVVNLFRNRVFMREMRSLRRFLSPAHF